MAVQRMEPRVGQESLWDYPKPPRVERTDKHISIVFNGKTIAHTHNAVRVLQTGIPPVYYIPPEDVNQEYLTRTDHHTTCEYKGVADYWTIEVNGKTVTNAGWSYPNPSPGYEAIKDHLALYAHLVDAAYVGNEQAQPPEWEWIGGWVTPEVVGPFITREQAQAEH